MIMILLMALDLISLVMISLVQFGSHVSFQFILMAGIYLLSKPFIFKDFMSWVDFGVGIYFIISVLFGGINFLYWIIFAWFIYKFIFTIIYSFG